MCDMYHKLTEQQKQFVQMGIGASTVLYIVGILPYWIPLIISSALIVHGAMHAGLYQKLMQNNKFTK